MALLTGGNAKIPKFPGLLEMLILFGKLVVELEYCTLTVPPFPTLVQQAGREVDASKFSEKLVTVVQVVLSVFGPVHAP
ncbi:hypothetical protein D3C80_1252390 [compost metagenome]